MSSLISLISNLGFPIVLCIYLLTRIEEKLDRLSENIFSLSEILKKFYFSS